MKDAATHTHDDALQQMRYHLAQQDVWQRRVVAREMENKAALQKELSGRRRSRLGLKTPFEYHLKQFNDADFWLKQYSDNRDHHQKQALMWATAAQALKETPHGL